MDPEPVEERAQRVDARGIELVDAPVAVRPIEDQVGLLEHAQVLGDRRPADREVAGQLADRQRAAQQALEDRAPGGVAERVHLRVTVSLHLR